MGHNIHGVGVVVLASVVWRQGLCLGAPLATTTPRAAALGTADDSHELNGRKWPSASVLV